MEEFMIFQKTGWLQNTFPRSFLSISEVEAVLVNSDRGPNVV